MAEERAEEEAAVMRVQCAWRIKKGKFALHLKRQARAEYHSELARKQAEARRIEVAAVRVQCRWRIKTGQFALHMKRQAKHLAEEEEKAMVAAAIRVQCRWRIKKGQFSLHMRKQARARRYGEEEYAAAQIQRLYRGRQDRARMMSERDAAIRLQVTNTSIQTCNYTLVVYKLREHDAVMR